MEKENYMRRINYISKESLKMGRKTEREDLFGMMEMNSKEIIKKAKELGSEFLSGKTGIFTKENLRII